MFLSFLPVHRRRQIFHAVVRDDDHDVLSLILRSAAHLHRCMQSRCCRCAQKQSFRPQHLMGRFVGFLSADIDARIAPVWPQIVGKCAFRHIIRRQNAIMESAARSFTLPVGLKNPSFASRCAPHCCCRSKRSSSISGVRPTSSSMECTSPAIALPSRFSAQTSLSGVTSRMSLK